MFDSDEKVLPGPTVRTKDAATLVIVRGDKAAPRVLMGKRHANLVFQPNKYVFPGGRLDPGDLRISAGGDFQAHVRDKLCIGTPLQRARGLALAAIRETFEEAGVLVGEHATDLPRTRAPAWKAFFAHGVTPRLDRLEFIARAVTPPGRPRRFDARFFMVDADAIARELDSPSNEELLTPAWLTLAEARALELPSITRRILDEVEARIAEGHDATRPIPFFRYTRGNSGLTWL